MKIAHVVTYISPDGAFGGPVRVALGQAEALAMLGHEVTIYAAAPIATAEIVTRDGYTLRTFPARQVHKRLGFAGMRAIGLTRALREQLPDLDVAHVHVARDLVTLPAIRAIQKSNIDYFLQPHGMIDASSRLLARPVDALATKSALERAAKIFTLTSIEEQEIRAIAPKSNLEPIRNGIKIPQHIPEYNDRLPMILFLARLHPRKRATTFVSMAARLAPLFPKHKFIIAGPDEGEGAVVEKMIADTDNKDQIKWIGAVEPSETSNLLRSAQVYVLPSVGEIFPMSVLEALQMGTPTVVTDSLGISSECDRYEAAVVTDGSVQELSSAVEAIITSASAAQTLRDGGFRYLRSELNIEAVARQLETAYSDSVATVAAH